MAKENKEPHIIYRANLDNLEVAVPAPVKNPLLFKEIPWDCLSESRRNIVYDYVYNRLDFRSIARKYDLYDEAFVKKEFYYALTTLAEYAKMREFLDEYYEELNPQQLEILNSYYCNNNTMLEIAEELNLTRQAVQQTIKRVINKYSVKWSVFAKRQGNKVIYSIPEGLR